MKRGQSLIYPEIEEPIRYRKKRGGKKPFIIEARWTGKRQYWFASKVCDKWFEWHFYSRYRTEKQRDDALQTLQRKGNDPHNMPVRSEYRKGN